MSNTTISFETKCKNCSYPLGFHMSSPKVELSAQLEGCEKTADFVEKNPCLVCLLVDKIKVLKPEQRAELLRRLA